MAGVQEQSKDQKSETSRVQSLEVQQQQNEELNDNWGQCVFCGKPAQHYCSCGETVKYCSQDCMIKYWNQGHKNDVRHMPQQTQRQQQPGVFVFPDQASSLGGTSTHSPSKYPPDMAVDQDNDSPGLQQQYASDSSSVHQQQVRSDNQRLGGSQAASLGIEQNGSQKSLFKMAQRQQQRKLNEERKDQEILINENESMRSERQSDNASSIAKRTVQYATTVNNEPINSMKSSSDNRMLVLEKKTSSKEDGSVKSNNQQLQVRKSMAKEQVEPLLTKRNQQTIGGNNTQSPNVELQSQSQPLVWNEQFKIFEVNLKQRDDSKWVQVLILLAKGDINSATKNAELMLKQRKLLEENKDKGYGMNATYSLKDIYGLVCEGLLLAKCKLLKSDIPSVESLLDECDNYLAKMNINVKDIKKQFAEQTREQKENKASVNDDRSSAYTAKKTANVRGRPASSNVPTFADYKWMLSAYATIAAFYNAVGNQVKCELIYVKYVQWIEKYFGKDSIEASNCYFLVGLYYYEQQAWHQSLACFIKALYIRTKEQGEGHISCADCHLNIGILYKKLNCPNKAISSLEKALSIRRECIGPQSLQVANVLEEIGKYHLERHQFKQSSQCFQQCYEIRKKIIRKSHHEDVERVSCLILYLHKQIEQELQEKQKTSQRPLAKLMTLNSQVQDMLGKKQVEDLDPGKIFEQNGITMAQKLMKGIFEIQVKPELKLMSQPLEVQENQIQKAVKNYMKQIITQDPEEQQVPQSKQNSSPPLQMKQKKAQKFQEDEDIEQFINSGFNSYIEIVKTQLYDKILPYVIAFFLSLTQQQMVFLQKCQLNNEHYAPIYVPLELKESLDHLQQDLFVKSQLWKVSRSKYLQPGSTTLSLQKLLIPESSNKPQMRQQLSKDQRFFKLLNEVPEFIDSLSSTQKRILQNAIKYQITCKYFLISITPQQMKDFSKLVKERLDEEESLVTLKELASVLNINNNSILGTKQNPDSISKILDYKQEMCLVIDNIRMIEVFGCINVDLTENFLSNLHINQIQRLTKIKQELQTKNPDIEEIQDTLKRFIMDLDTKEAYEFSVLNPFLINEEELETLVNELMNDQQTSSEGRNQLRLDAIRREESSASSDEEEQDSYMEQSPSVSDQQTDAYRMSLQPRLSVLKNDMKEQLKNIPKPQSNYHKSSTFTAYQNNKAIDYIRKKDQKTNVRKSLMNVDLDRIASDAVNRNDTVGQSSFSFTNDNMLAGGHNGTSGINMSQDFKAGIAEVEDERDFSELSSDPEDMYNDQGDLSITNGTIIRNLMQK